METVKTAKALVRCPFCGTLNRVDANRAADRPACGDCGKPLLLDRPVPVTDNDLERIVKETEIPVVVDFYADWCGPCKFMAPIFDDAARERAGQVLFTKLDTDRNPAMATHYGIRGIPTLIVFKGGSEIARQVGAVPKAKLDELLDNA
ncbi:MAG TPA: thioredoxin TrxC [Longimicrobiales bacterium]|nr:thioredoxin TrxC [Longimicrobiales bacterium]